MESAGSLTISHLSGTARAVRRAKPCAGICAGVLGLVLASLALAGCAIEVGPPPEFDPPLVPERAKAPPPPQPTEPQAWSRDLDLEGGPPRIDRGRLAEGLVASKSGIVYSHEPLTFESALKDEGPQTAAERLRQRARERAAAAGQPLPPEVTAVPVEDVSAQALPPVGEQKAAAPRQTETPAPQDRRESRLPPPPKFPPLSKKNAGDAPPESPEEPPESTAVEEGQDAAAFAAAAWNAPAGTILVQVSAVQKVDDVVKEWQRLRARYPQVLKPLRLVVEEARLGEQGVFYRVQAGAFGTEEGATAACGSLIDAGQPCFVVVR